jgi:5-methylcytosine-specific restriction endonuclease McrA
MAATIEHHLPRSKGGKNKIENLRLAHRQCNQVKGDKLPVQEAPSDVQAIMDARRK